MKRKIILYSTTALLLLMAAQSTMAQTKGKKPNSFSPKMLVYENLKNDNVLKLQTALRTTRHSHQKPYMGESTSHRTGTQ